MSRFWVNQPIAGSPREIGSFRMAKKWGGFSVQNEVIKQNWDELLKMQDEPEGEAEPVALVASDEDQSAGEPEAAQPVPIIKTVKAS